MIKVLQVREAWYDINGNIEQIAQEEYPLIFPMTVGWKLTDKLYQSVLNSLNQLDLQNVTYGVITNQKATIIWDKATLEPVYNAIVWQIEEHQLTVQIATENNQSLAKKKLGY